MGGHKEAKPSPRRVTEARPLPVDERAKALSSRITGKGRRQSSHDMTRKTAVKTKVQVGTLHYLVECRPAWHRCARTAGASQTSCYLYRYMYCARPSLGPHAPFLTPVCALAFCSFFYRGHRGSRPVPKTYLTQRRPVQHRRQQRASARRRRRGQRATRSWGWWSRPLLPAQWVPSSGPLA